MIKPEAVKYLQKMLAEDGIEWTLENCDEYLELMIPIIRKVNSILDRNPDFVNNLYSLSDEEVEERLKMLKEMTGHDMTREEFTDMLVLVEIIEVERKDNGHEDETEGEAEEG